MLALIDLDYQRLVRAARSLPKQDAAPALKVALLSDAATQQFVPLLRVLLAESGLPTDIYEGAFDAIELESINAHSGLHRFNPDVIVIAECTQALRDRYYRHGGPGFVEASEARMLRTWDALRKHSRANIIQFNFALPYERQFGNFDLLVPDSFHSTILRLNRKIAESARRHANILACDVEAIASWHGRKFWYDDRLWNLAKTFCSLELLPQVAKSIVDIVRSTKGRVVKCVVLDLDNTLWGGVVGDDGPLGILIGAHGDGEPFHHFQQYLLSLKQRGILLAVCSKNEMANALAPFSENPEMVLKRDDITVFIANWENKADNLRRIRDTLEIGLDSMVFLDDNPFERNLVRQLVPEVLVPEMPEDPAEYVRAVSLLNLFETTSFSAEDTARAELYKREAARREIQNSYSNIDVYLKSLEMKMELARFTKPKLTRIAQLIQRSNQFNLTTHRYNESECEALMLDRENFIPLYAALSDRLGEHGLISIVILRLTEGEIHITDWLMSCRVLVRGVEQTLMTHVVKLARKLGASSIRGEFIPSPKNAMVKDFYRQFDFEKTVDSGTGTVWKLNPESYKPSTTYIEVLEH